MAKEVHSWLETIDYALQSDSVPKYVRAVVACVREQS